MKRIVNLLFLSYFITNLYAKENLTIGAGITAISIPSYIGSSKQNYMIIPIPYIEYIGKYFSIDRDKLYGKFYTSQDIQLELDVSGMIPVYSKDTLREGMKDLDAIIEIGPKFIYNIVKGDDIKFNFEIPLKGSFSIGDSILKYQGLSLNLDLSYQNIFYKKYKVNIVSGFGFRDKNINNYYYEVNKDDSTANRAEYHSSTGYSGIHNSFALTRKYKHYWYGMFIKHYYLKGSTFRDSSLVETDNSIFSGVAFSYIF